MKENAHKCPACGELAAWGPDTNVCTSCYRASYVRMVEGMKWAQIKRLCKDNRVPFRSNKTAMGEKLADILIRGVA